jgi:hypothetical protein
MKKKKEGKNFSSMKSTLVVKLILKYNSKINGIEKKTTKRKIMLNDLRNTVSSIQLCVFKNGKTVR